MSEQMPVQSIFINYRRSDSEGEAGRLSDVLSRRFTEQGVFMDVDAILPGRDFRKAIEESVEGCAVLLTVIGPDWLETRNAQGQRRIDEDNDYVRLEIAAALRRDVAVIPVLIRGAKVPRPDQLPPDIEDLAYRNGVELTHSRWRSDLQILMRALDPYMTHITQEMRDAAMQTRTFSIMPGGIPKMPTPIVPVPVPPPPVAAKPTVSKIDAETLERVSRRLATYIGPIAGLMVRRASMRCETLRELSEQVAGEIEDPVARRRFLAEQV